MRVGVGAVHLVQADLTTLTPAEVCPPGPFDLAYGHFVLCDQRDVVGVLQRIAATVRPGGYIVAQEALLTAPIPVETPGRFNRAANLLINEWLPALLGTLGTCWDVAERYSMLCREAGLVEVSQRLFTPTLPPAHAGDGTGVYRDILTGVRPLLRRFDIASEDRIDRTLRDLDMAIDEGRDATLFTHIRVELVARVPDRDGVVRQRDDEGADYFPHHPCRDRPPLSHLGGPIPTQGPRPCRRIARGGRLGRGTPQASEGLAQ